MSSRALHPSNNDARTLNLNSKHEMEPDTTTSSSSPEASDTLTVLREALRQGDLERLAAQTEYQWIESEHQRATERFSAADAKCKGIVSLSLFTNCESTNAPEATANQRREAEAYE